MDRAARTLRFTVKGRAPVATTGMMVQVPYRTIRSNTSVTELALRGLHRPGNRCRYLRRRHVEVSIIAVAGSVFVPVLYLHPQFLAILAELPLLFIEFSCRSRCSSSFESPLPHQNLSR